MSLIKFETRYPNWNMGFLADNPMTETEKLVGYRMHLLFRENKTYQCFGIHDEYYEELLERIKDVTPGYVVEMQLNKAVLHLINKDNVVLGYCVQTRELVAIEKNWHYVISIPDMDENREAFWHEAMK